MELPLKIAGCWDWFPKPKNEIQILVNHVYFGMVLFVLTHVTVGLAINLYTEWQDIMSSLDKIADSLPLLVSLAIVTYHSFYRKEFYELIRFLDENFKYRSANGLTNMTMLNSYKAAKGFWKVYTACTMFSVTMYAVSPVVFHLWTKEPIQSWIYMDVTKSPFIEFVFLRSCLAQLFVGLAMGQFGVFFAANAILICGQLDLLCCSLRNVRYTAMLRCGVRHAALVTKHADILNDEMHNYMYNSSEMTESVYHYDHKMLCCEDVKSTLRKYVTVSTNTKLYVYERCFDDATSTALRDCARLCQVVMEYKDKFESFVSPLLALRVVQVTLYLCTLLYAATLKFDMITVEYLAAVALDTFIYCYFGNQIILQASRVSTAAYQSTWYAMDIGSRRILLNILLANRRPVVVRAGRFLPMDLHTFVVIIKTSFSYYTLLVNVNESRRNTI
ncbi:hypothetical protein K1T71_011081 [Dendrolimus kikuchii]|uniref:Uncharacterized protein n=1 Tax=Dendrolimus kikuchii TaxID=765133 RepID=A0ACC1CMU9_9NEOP|nr:hypothetical protein K1T71_011081 [Dendrolimus kikuchii]